MARHAVVAVLGIAFLAGLTQPGRTASAQEAAPVVVVRAFWDAFNAHDVDVALAFYADDAVIDGCCQGKTQLRESLVREFSRNRRYELSNIRVVGSTVSWHWKLFEDPDQQLQIVALEGENTAVVEDGVIHSLAPTVDPDSPQRRTAANTAVVAAALARLAAQATQTAQATGVAESGVLHRLPDTQGRGTRSITPWVAAGTLSILAVAAVTTFGSRNQERN